MRILSECGRTPHSIVPYLVGGVKPCCADERLLLMSFDRAERLMRIPDDASKFMPRPKPVFEDAPLRAESIHLREGRYLSATSLSHPTLPSNALRALVKPSLGEQCRSARPTSLARPAWTGLERGTQLLLETADFGSGDAERVRSLAFTQAPAASRAAAVAPNAPMVPVECQPFRVVITAIDKRFTELPLHLGSSITR